jgi:N-acetylmuramoyl-L-alanine amidase
VSNKIVKIFLLAAIMFFSYSLKSISAEELPTRVDGKDRFEVAVKLSQEWEQTNTIILANYLAYADALAAGPLAYKKDAPILLTQKDKLNSATRVEIQRLKPQEVIIIGGKGSVSENVKDELLAAGVKRIERISGKDRFRVAENIALKIGSWEKAVVAYGLNFPDALAIAPYAARNQYPILLTMEDTIPASTLNIIRSKGVKKTLIVGGEGSISKKVEAQLPAPVRIGGKDRFEVAANIANKFFPGNKAFLATGMSFADALTGSVVSARQNAPMLLTASAFVPEETLSYFENHLVEGYIVLGGIGSVSDDLVSDVQFYKKSNQPIIYFVPHADDEVLTFGIDIVNQLSHNRDVKLVLLSKGDDTSVRDILNGHFDEESTSGYLNLPFKCNWHGVYHDPVPEHFLHGHISRAEFGDIRIEDYKRAAGKLGINQGNIIVNTIPINNFTMEEIKKVIRQYLLQYPVAQVRTMSFYDLHGQHAIIGKTLSELEKAGEINFLQTSYFLSVYTDHIAKKYINLPLRTLTVNDSVLNGKIDLAAGVYKEYDPVHGRYASGYHSVARQFELIKSNQYIRYHH